MSGRTAWYTDLGPDGREICVWCAWDGGPHQQAYDEASPCRYVLLPQIRLEPILKQRTQELNPKGVFFGYEVDRVEENDSHIIVRLHERKRGESTAAQSITAAFDLAADGGRLVANQLGISMNGESDVVDLVSAHVRAPISKHRPDPSIFLHWFINPTIGGSLKTGYFYHLGPHPLQSETEEWMFACARLPHEQAQPFTDEDMLNRLQRTLQIPDLDVELLSVSHWFVIAINAETYRSHGGRVFLIGD